MKKTVGSKRMLLRNSFGVWEILPAIVAIVGQEFEEIHRNPTDKEISDCNHWFGDDLITPGFIDSHTHLSLQFLRGNLGLSAASAGNLVEDLFFKLEEKLTADDVRAFTRMGAYEVLLSGTTFVWDHYYYGAAIAEGMAEVGLTGTIASTLQDLSGPGYKHWESGIEFTEFLNGDHKLKSKGLYPALGPHATDTVSANLWNRIIEHSDRMKIPIHSHVAQSPEEYLRVNEKYGCSPVAWLDRLGVLNANSAKHFVHLIYASDSDLILCKKKEIRLVACPHSQMIFHFPASFIYWWRQRVDWTVGTDCSASNDTWSMSSELRTIASWPMIAASFSSEVSRFMESPSPQTALQMSAQRNSIAGEKLIDENNLLDVLFLGSSSGKASHPKASGISHGSLANLLVWNIQDPAFWPMTNLPRSLMFNAIQPALKGLMTIGEFRGEIGRPRESIINQPAYQTALLEASQRLTSLVKRCGIN